MPDCVKWTTWDYYSSGGTLGTFGIADVKDPVQGVYLKNCSLIAALASLAWKGKISTQPPGPQYTYTFKFYPSANPQKTDGKLPLNSTGKLMHAKSDTPTEIWPALYEKAYYQWLENLGLDYEQGRPNYCSHIEWQDPRTVLSQLTGKTVSPKPKTPLVAVTAFDDIDAFCVNLVSNTNRAIQSPAVAWTYDTGSQYSDTTIVVKHTYSLLGVAGKKDINGKWTDKYVVLRNPYGKSKGDPAMPAGSLYTGALWCKNINLGDNDGLFALKYDLFAQYFAGYAWTTI